MTRVQEEQVVLAGGTTPLRGVLYRPRETSEQGLLVCHPLFEERKAAHRTIVEAARAFCSAGFSVLRFDYCGCGDSGGDFRDFTIKDWLGDIRAAQGFLRVHTGCRSIGLFGLRLGATFALMAARASTAGFVIAWEPVINGAAHLKQELRKTLVKQMMTYGQSQASREEMSDSAAAGHDIDFDGFAITPRLYEDLCAVDLTQSEAPPETPALLSAVTHNGRPSRPLEAWCRRLAAAGSDVDLHAHRLPPFWNRVGLADCSELIRDTRAWLTQLKTPSRS